MSALAQPALPPAIGRYVVVAEIGIGGMGRVLQGYDPELQRVVAIKLLKVSRVGPAAASIARFRREAEALAHLAHPGVVEIFEVGVAGDSPYIVMELVPGKTLREWLDEEPRDPDAILDVFAQAGEALAAAHIAGIVHRDFKPDNVMISDDGRVRVLDFGLAALADEFEPTDPSKSGRATHSGSQLRLTETGVLLGTPAYMSPEQHLGGAVGPASDQFSFCVALAEALHGTHPFPASSLEDLCNVVLQRRVQLPPPRGRAGRLRATLMRGLSVQPGDRWPRMGDLLAALAERPARRAPALVAAAVALAALGLAWPAPNELARAGVASPGATKTGGPPIPEDESTATAVAEVRRRLEAVEDMVTAGTYAAAHREAAAVVREAGETGFAPVIIEADFRLASLTAVLGRRNDARELLETTYYAAIANGYDALAVDAAYKLVDVGWGEGRDPALIVHWLSAAEAVLERLPADDDAHVWHGFWATAIESERGHREAAVAGFRQACTAFVDHELPASAQARCFATLGMALDGASRHEEALEATARGLELAELAFGETHPKVATDYANRGLVLLHSGSLDEAEASVRAGVKIFDATVGPEHAQAANARVILSNVLQQAGKYAQTESLLREAIPPLARDQGDAAPQTIAARSLLAVAYSELDRVPEAEALFLEQSAALDASGQGRTFDAAQVLVNLANTAGMQGHADVAEQRIERALEILEDVPNPKLEAFARHSQAQARFERGDYEGAVPILQRTRELLARIHGEESAPTAGVLLSLGLAALKTDRFQDAADYYARAVTMFRATLGEAHPRYAVALRRHGHALRHLGRRKQAVALEKRAHAIAPETATDVPPCPG